MQKPEDFLTHHATYVDKEQLKTCSYSFNSVKVLPELTDKPWDSVALSYVLSLDPVAIRVTTGMCTCDGMTGRITVYINEETRLIEEISKECRVFLPDDVQDAHCLRLAMEHGKDSKLFRFFNRDNIATISYMSHDTTIYFHDGTKSSFKDFE